jgi:hypothetical protein
MRLSKIQVGSDDVIVNFGINRSRVFERGIPQESAARAESRSSGFPEAGSLSTCPTSCTSSKTTLNSGSPCGIENTAYNKHLILESPAVCLEYGWTALNTDDTSRRPSSKSQRAAYFLSPHPPAGSESRV